MEDSGPDEGVGKEAAWLSRRRFVSSAAAVAAGATLFAGPARGQQQEDVRKAEADKNPHGPASNPGPENKALAAESPDSEMTPPTDHGDTPAFWYSFALARKRVEEGGWARQQNVKDLPIATEMAAVNMRLTSGGIRELHWHAAAEWALMLTGSARLTAIDNEGNSYVQDVNKGDLWYFPTGVPHSIQGLGPDGCEFLLVFDDGKFSEFDTTLVSDWTAHTPREVLAKNWGVAEAALAHMPKEELYIFQAGLPGPLEEDQRAARGTGRDTTAAFEFRASTMAPTFATASGEVRVIDTRNFPMSVTIAAAIVRLKPGGLRELHWHPGSDEWQYWAEGQGRMTLFINGGKARTMDFHAGDIGYVPRTLGHYIENTGDTELVFLEMFKANKYEDFSLSEWMRRTPPKLVMDHLKISEETLGKIPAKNYRVVPVKG
jgi:oxalate decarboxylase